MNTLDAVPEAMGPRITTMPTVTSAPGRLQPAGATCAAACGRASDLRCCLSNFDVLYAAAIAAWVTSPRELIWLAPSTLPPLTAAKVAAWGRDRSHRLLFWNGEHTGPLGYAELNKMPRRPDQMWIGHCILAPAARGRGLGRRFVQALCRRAFHDLAAVDVSLVVIPENRAAIACYQKSGLIVNGHERKYFEATRRVHDFLRMGIDRRRYERLVSAGRLPRSGIPFIPDAAALRQGSAARRRALTRA